MADTNMLIVRFRVYFPNGASRGILPHPLSWEAGLPLNDMTSLTMTYPDGSDAANILRAPCEVALELRDPNTGVFTEHPGCRFINIKNSVDMAARPRILSFTMPSYGWMLKKARWMDQDNPRLNKENQIVYRENDRVVAAQPVRDLLNYAKNRQNVPGLTYTFNNVQDSTGFPWSTSHRINGASFDYGQDAWSIIDSFAKQGFFDWRMNKRELEIFRPDTTLNRRLDTDTGVHLHSMVAMGEEPVERSWEDLAGHLVALGDNTVSWLVETNPDITFPWGKWDETISASGVSDDQTLAQITDRMLETRFKSRTQYTKRLVWTEGAPIPLVDYRPGDYIRATGDSISGSQKSAMRVYQITLTSNDPYGVSIALTLNDRFTDRALQVERWVARSTGGGGSVGGGGTGGGTSKPPPPPVDSTPPKAPTLNSVTNSPYFSALGDPLSLADVAFTAVLKDTNNRNIDVLRYNVSARREDHTEDQAVVSMVRGPGSPSSGQVLHGRVPNLDSGYTYFFSVQAVRASAYPSAWSNVISQTMGYPTQGPPVPSTPILSSKLSTVKAEWDGKSQAGFSMPTSFREVQVEVSVNNSNWYHAGDIFSPGASLIMSGKGGIPTWNVGDTVYVRFKARNSASVISAASAIASTAVLGVVGPDIAANTITANNVVAGTLTAEQIKAHSLTVESLSVGNPSNLVVDPTFSSGPLNTARLTQAANSSAGGVAWSVTADGAVRVDNNVTATSFSRFGLSNNTILNYQLQGNPGATLPSNELAIPINRPGGAASTAAGAIKARMVVKATGVPASPGASTITVSMLTRMFQRSGAPFTGTNTLINNFSISANGTFTLESIGGWSIPSGIASFLPYIYVQFQNGVNADVALEFTQIEVWQESSVFIGQGQISAPLIEGNAITADKLAADAITAKHSIKSAYYEMDSSSPGAIVKIMANANYAGQSGIVWEGLTNFGPRIFQADAAGSGGWDARGFVLTGPEQTVNSSGRLSLQMSYGVGKSYLGRDFGSEVISQQGIYWDTSVARFRIGGMFNTGHYTNDMFRMDRMSFQNGTYAYGAVTARKYYPIITPNGGTAPATSSVYQFPNGTEGGFRWVSSTGVTEIFFIAVCGTP